MAMASRGLEYIESWSPGNATQGAGKSASKELLLLLNPPIDVLVTFGENSSGELANSRRQFRGLPHDVRRVVNVALNDFKIDSRARASSLLPLSARRDMMPTSGTSLSSDNQGMKRIRSQVLEEEPSRKLKYQNQFKSTMDKESCYAAGTLYHEPLSSVKSLEKNSRKQDPKKFDIDSTTVRLKFNQGFSNAVRRPVHLSDFI